MFLLDSLLLWIIVLKGIVQGVNLSIGFGNSFTAEAVKVGKFKGLNFFIVLSKLNDNAIKFLNCFLGNLQSGFHLNGKLFNFLMFDQSFFMLTASTQATAPLKPACPWTAGR